MTLAPRLDTPVVEMKDRVDRPIRSAVLTVAAVRQHHSRVVAVGSVATQLLPERVAVEISTALGTCSGAIDIRLLIQRNKFTFCQRCAIEIRD